MTELTPEAAMDKAEAEKAAWEGSPKLRLLYCKTCHVLEELPWMPRRLNQEDPFLENMVRKHEHGKPSDVAGHCQLMDVPVVFWNNPQKRDALVRQIYNELSPGLDAIAPGYYDLKNNLSADALQCYVKHNKPTDGNCSDWHADNKKVYPDTAAERKDAGLGKRTEGTFQYLCSACPVAVVRQQRAYEKAGV